MLGENALKSKLFFFVMVFLFFTLLCCVQVSAAEFSWKDDFNYANIQDMQNAGWVLDNPSGTSLQAQGVVIDGMNADTVIRYRGFPEGLYDWSVETQSMWIGGNHSCPGLDVITEKHVYSFSGNGWYDDLNFDRDGVTETIGSYVDQAGWVTMTMTKTGDTINLYLNGELMKTYVEPDSSLSALIEVDRIAPWHGVMVYDYYQVTGSAAASGDSTILYVVVGGGTAGAVAVGAAAYWYFIAGKAAEAAAGSAGAAGGIAAVDEKTKEVAMGKIGGVLTNKPSIKEMVTENAYNPSDVRRLLERQQFFEKAQQQEIEEKYLKIKEPEGHYTPEWKIQQNKNNTQESGGEQDQQKPTDNSQETQEVADNGENSENTNA